MKIIALLPVKNEDWCLRKCLESLSFVDEILAIDDNSSDTTRQILEDYQCTIIECTTDIKFGWNEYHIRTTLLNEARLREGTHIISIDADEACSTEFQKNARKIFNDLDPGRALECEWLNLCSLDSYKTPQIFKTFAFCDDGIAQFPNTQMDVPRVPLTALSPLRMSPENKILHFQFLDKRRCALKQAWYMMSKLKLKTGSTRRINNTHSHAKNYVCKKLNYEINIELIPEINPESNIWYKDEIIKLFDEYSITFFEGLDIWSIPELSQMFIERTGKVPKPKFYPKWLILLNKLKNRIYK